MVSLASPKPSLSSSLNSPVLTIAIDGFCGRSMVSGDVSVTGSPSGSSASAVAVLSTASWSTSSCDSVYVAVHCVVAPGTSVPPWAIVEQAIVLRLRLSAGASNRSVTDRLVNVWLPSLVTS